MALMGAVREGLKRELRPTCVLTGPRMFQELSLPRAPKPSPEAGEPTVTEKGSLARAKEQSAKDDDETESEDCHPVNAKKVPSPKAREPTVTEKKTSADAEEPLATDPEETESEDWPAIYGKKVSSGPTEGLIPRGRE